MRKPLLCSSVKVAEESSGSSEQQGFNVMGESRVERVCKILASPLTKKKSSHSAERTFGVPLEELLRRASDSHEVPVLVTKICEYIEGHGLHQEGIFRVNGSTRTIEKLRASFDRNGDANLEEAGDVMAAAGLLKQFLRALPEAVIPGRLHWQFIKAQEEHPHDNEECIRQLKRLVEQLPEDNFNLLKYLMRFLVRVTRAEDYNRMNPGALGIIFGPNLFRVAEGDDALRQQAVTNQVVTKFIKDYAAIFEADQEAPTTNQFLEDLIDKTQTSMEVDDGLESQDIYLNQSKSSHHMETGHSSRANDILSVSEDFQTLPASALDKGVTELIEVSICKSVDQHLFGECDSDDHSRHPLRVKHRKSELSPDGAAVSKVARSNSEERAAASDTEPTSSVGAPPQSSFRGSSKSAADEHGSDDAADINSGTALKASTTSSRQDHSLMPLNIDTSSQHATPDMRMKDWGRRYEHESDVSEARRSIERLQYRSTPSKNRRNPSLRSSRRCLSMEVVRKELDAESIKENGEGRSSSANNNKTAAARQPKRSSSMSLTASPADTTDEDEHMQDVCATKSQKSRLWLLDLHDASASSATNQHHDRNSGEDGSVSSGAGCSKPYVPPLDLSILHEHGDGNEPIPTHRLRSSWPFANRHHDNNDDVMLSPRTSSLEKKSSFHSDHNIPPSPPVEQEEVRKCSAKVDEYSETAFKVLSKKISSLKRKVKLFEDGFESEYGYRPSHADKMNHSSVKKYVTELVKARKELKQLKEESRQVSMTSNLLASQARSSFEGKLSASASVNHGSDSTFVLPTMDDSLLEMVRKLSDKRRLAKRPEDFDNMNREQILDEKLAMQKALLHFENIHGHPTSKQEKELMKPIYERYRNVKRLAAKASSPKGKDSAMELQPILEHVTMDFTQASPKHQSRDASLDDSDELGGPVSQRSQDNEQDEEGGDQSTSLPDVSAVQSKSKLSRESCNLHELPREELMEQSWKVRHEKKHLRRRLREFEEEFQRQTGRKAQKEDRAPMDTTYLEYKQVKAKLKLLEALISKYEHHYTI